MNAKLIAILLPAALSFGSARAGTLQFLASSYNVPTEIDGSDVIGTFNTSTTTSGWLYNGSTYTSLAAPSATRTVPSGVSGGIVSGYYVDASKKTHAFLYNGSTYTNIDDPLGVKGSGANAISGTNVVGTYIDSNSLSHGFLYNGTTWTTIDDPLGAEGTGITAISGSNILGTYSDSQGHSHGFLYNGTTFTTFDDPLAVSTYPHAISGSNIVGQYSDATFAIYSFYFNGTTWTTLAAPGANSTAVSGISGGNAVGTATFFNTPMGYVFNGSTYSFPLSIGDFGADASGFTFNGISGNKILGTAEYSIGQSLVNIRGFIYTIPEPSTLVLATLAAGILAFGSRGRTRNRSSPR